MTRKILLADDSVTIQKVVELTFAEGNFQVVCVSNGKAAIQKLQEDRPDILLSDVIMPEMNGYDVASFVKHNPAYSAIPVILLTGTFEPFDEEKARQSGADTYITKPFDSKMLVDKVEELLKRRVSYDAAAASGPVQVIQSRTEFQLGEEMPPPAAAPALEPLPPQELGQMQDENPFAEPAGDEHRFLASPDLGLEPDQTVRMDASALRLQEAPVEEEPAVVAAPAPAEPAPPAAPFAPVVDLGEVAQEELPDTAFSAVVAPEAGVFGRDEVNVPASDREAWPMESEPSPAAETAPAESVSGAEDWGQGQAFAGTSDAVLDAPEAFEPPPVPLEPAGGLQPELEVVQSLSDQQAMVAEAHQRMAATAPLPEPPADAFEPASAQPPEPITGAYEMAAQEPPMETWAAKTDAGPVSASPFEEPAPSHADAIVDAAEELPPAPVAQPVAAEFAPPTDTGAYPTPTEQSLDAPPVAPAPAPSAEVSAPPMDRAGLEEAVRQSVLAALPALVAGALPLVARSHVAELLPELARQHAAEHLPGVLAPMVGEAVPAEVQRAVAEAVPEHVRQVTKDLAPDIIARAAQDVSSEQIAKAVREIAPDIIRQVAWEVIPELAESIIRRRIQELESESG